MSIMYVLIAHFHSRLLRVKELQNFTIDCSLCGNELNCAVAEGYAPALDKSNYCTINNDTSTRKEC